MFHQKPGNTIFRTSRKHIYSEHTIAIYVTLIIKKVAKMTNCLNHQVIAIGSLLAECYVAVD